MVTWLNYLQLVEEWIACMQLGKKEYNFRENILKNFNNYEHSKSFSALFVESSNIITAIFKLDDLLTADKLLQLYYSPFPQIANYSLTASRYLIIADDITEEARAIIDEFMWGYMPIAEFKENVISI